MTLLSSSYHLINALNSTFQHNFYSHLNFKSKICEEKFVKEDKGEAIP